MQETIFDETNMEEMTEEGNGKKKKKRGSCGMIFLIVFVCFIVIFVVNCIRNYGVRTDFDSIDEFDEYGGVVLVEIPEGASDIKYYCNKIYIFGLESAYSFVLNDMDEYNAFMEANEFEIHNDRTVEIYMTDPPMHGGEFPILNWYKYVVEEDISDYIFLEYDSFDGSFSAILVDEESRKFVVISHNVL